MPKHQKSDPFPVFRGEQPDGTEVAIKALATPKESGFEEEVRVLSMFRHPNLVTLMGFARNGNQRFLVYELMEGGDLFNRLYNSRKGRQDFLWRDRLCVAFDAACGLSHLHFQTPKVFHRDIKSMNILLSRSGTAKVADFGLASISKKRGAHRPGSLAGTPGYMCPIYEKTCVITERSEVRQLEIGDDALPGDSLSAFLLVFLLVVAEKERRYFLNRTAPMVELPVPSPSHEVMVEAGRQFRALRRSLIQMVMDVCGVLGILVLTAYTVRIILLGRDSLSCGEMSHVVLLVLWLLTCSAFHTGVLTYGEGQIIFLMYVFNLLTLGMTVYIDEVAKPMLEPMILVGRIVGSLVFLDWRHAICCNCLFAARRFQQRAHEDFAQLANSFVSEFCVCTLILIVPWALQVLMQKWISIIVAASDLDMALRAAKAVIASSCDAEAEMTSDLRLHQVSFKLAHMLGQQPSELEGKHFSKMLQEESRQRFEACCQAARAQAERTSQPAASSVIVTVNARSARKDVEVRICNLSPLSQGGGRYIAALLEVGNSPEEAPDVLQEDEAGKRGYFLVVFEFSVRPI
ncbi:unnamed protein product [Symbiodinium natans]|uniref:non-specific serine/threonine protein kinase n=1 Tax=Symbiodinium natans TaxID=878477 RepID=A0A812NPX8_9DINO|nr:unnamed protein product [Symbiodinium natans]